jgi:Gpi18-like mannosyltransferase
MTGILTLMWLTTLIPGYLAYTGEHSNRGVLAACVAVYGPLVLAAQLHARRRMRIASAASFNSKFNIVIKE